MNANVTGEQRTIKLLEAFDRDSYNEIGKQFRAAGKIVRDEARANTPAGNALSGWGRWIAVDRGRDLGFVGTRVRSKISVSLSQDRRNWGNNLYMVRIVTMDWGGAVYTLSGSKQKRYTQERSYRGRTFTDNLNAKYAGDRYPRGLLAAVISKGPEARPRLEAAMAEATRRADLIINRGG